MINVHNERILITTVQGLGDMILSLPAINRYAARNKTRFTVIASDGGAAELLKCNPYVDKIILWHERKSLYENVVNIYSSLKNSRFSHCFFPHPAARRECLIAFLVNSDKFCGFKRSRNILLDKIFAHRDRYLLTYLDKREHHSLANLRLFGFDAKYPEYGDRHLYFTVEENAAWDLHFKNIIGPNADDILVAVHPGAKAIEKRWPCDNWGNIADGLMAFSPNVKFLVFGGKDEEELVNSLVGRIGGNAFKIYNASIRQVAWLIQKCKLFIGNDSALMHIAALQDVPVVAIFGHTNYKAFGPIGRKSIVVRLDLPCSPCADVFSYSMSHCPHKFSCINDVSASLVLEVSKMQLSEKGFSETGLKGYFAYASERLPAGGLVLNVVSKAFHNAQQ